MGASPTEAPGVDPVSTVTAADASADATTGATTVRNLRWSPWLSTVARLVLAGVFAAAALTKIGDVEVKVRAVRAYQLLPEGAVRPVAYALPYLELALAVLLLLGLATRLVAGVCATLLVLFIAAVASAGLRGLQIDCGCFGGGGAVAETRYLQEIGRDLLFLVAAGWLVWRPTSHLALDRVLEGES